MRRDSASGSHEGKAKAPEHAEAATDSVVTHCENEGTAQDHGGRTVNQSLTVKRK